jgi:hypothetical protein
MARARQSLVHPRPGAAKRPSVGIPTLVREIVR